MSENRYKDGSVEAHAYWHGRGVQAHEQSKEIDTLRAELERVRGERDAARAELEQREQDCIKAIHDWRRAVCLAQKLRGERAAARRASKAARAAAGAWKRSAKMWRSVAADEVSYAAGFSLSPTAIYRYRQGTAGFYTGAQNND